MRLLEKRKAVQMFIVLSYELDGSSKPELNFYTDTQHEGAMKKVAECKHMEVFVYRIDDLKGLPRRIIPEADKTTP
jgi:hypothetical protein